MTAECAAPNSNTEGLQHIAADADLLHRVQSGDPEAVRQFVSQNRDLIDKAIADLDATVSAPTEQPASDTIAADWALIRALQQQAITEYDHEVLAVRRLAWDSACSLLGSLPFHTARQLEHREVRVSWQLLHPNIQDIRGVPSQVSARFVADMPEKALSPGMLTLFSAYSGVPQKERHIRSALGEVGLQPSSSWQPLPPKAYIRQAFAEHFLAAADYIAGGTYVLPAGDEKPQPEIRGALHKYDLRRPDAITWTVGRGNSSTSYEYTVGPDSLQELEQAVCGYRQNANALPEPFTTEATLHFFRCQLGWQDWSLQTTHRLSAAVEYSKECIAI